MSLLGSLKRLLTKRATQDESGSSTSNESNDAELYEFVQGYAPAEPVEASRSELQKAVAHPVIQALIARHEVVSAFARGALGLGNDDAKLDSMLRYGPEGAYLAADVGRNTHHLTLCDLVKAEAEVNALKERVEAQQLLLEQAEQALTDEGVAYVELRAFLRGDMPAEDVISLLGRSQSAKQD